MNIEIIAKCDYCGYDHGGIYINMLPTLEDITDYINRCYQCNTEICSHCEKSCDDCQNAYCMDCIKKHECIEMEIEQQ